jgi:hypothetical protein
MRALLHDDVREGVYPCDLHKTLTKPNLLPTQTLQRSLSLPESLLPVIRHRKKRGINLPDLLLRGGLGERHPFPVNRKSIFSPVNPFPFQLDPIPSEGSHRESPLDFPLEALRGRWEWAPAPMDFERSSNAEISRVCHPSGPEGGWGSAAGRRGSQSQALLAACGGRSAGFTRRRVASDGFR